MIETTDYGRHVECDFCSVDYTDSKECGGLLFQSKAVCPRCAPATEASAIVNNETQYIRARCPADMPFADWVRDVVCGGQKRELRVLTGEDAERAMGFPVRNEEPPFPPAA